MSKWLETSEAAPSTIDNNPALISSHVDLLYFCFLFALLLTETWVTTRYRSWLRTPSKVCAPSTRCEYFRKSCQAFIHLWKNNFPYSGGVALLTWCFGANMQEIDCPWAHRPRWQSRANTIWDTMVTHDRMPELPQGSSASSYHLSHVTWVHTFLDLYIT